MTQIQGRGPATSYIAIVRDAPGEVRQLLVDAYSERNGTRLVQVTIREDDLVEAVRSLGYRIADRSVGDRLRELAELVTPVLFTVAMEDGPEDYVMDEHYNIRRTDTRASEDEYAERFRIEHFDMPPESDLTVHYPTA